jgi:hypothetical protein
MVVLPITVQPAGTADTPLPADGELIRGAQHYFPDHVGMEWTYTGSVADQVQRVSSYTNTAKVTGTTKKGKEQVLVFSESNPANRGKSESYFKKDKNGITYFGGEPTTELEDQIVPYLVIPFPIVLGRPYTQVQKTGLRYDHDIDHDGIKERVDMLSEITAVGFETLSVPGGTFQNVIKFEGKTALVLTLSRDQKKAEIIDNTTHWFALGVGMIKMIEKIEFPEVAGRAPTGTIVTETLTQFSGQDISRNKG